MATISSEVLGFTAGGDNDGDGFLDDTSGDLDRFAFVRFQPDGSLDTSFGDDADGTFLAYVGAGRNRMTGLTVNSAGEIWASGYDADRESVLFRFAEESESQLPVAVDDAYVTDEDTLLSVDAPGILANDSDGDSDSLTVLSFDSTSAQGASVSVSSDGSVSYDPRSSAALQNLSTGEMLEDSFSYTISDSRGGVATATVRVTVSGLDDTQPPTEDVALYVSDISFNSKRGGKDFRAVFEIRSDSDGDGNASADDQLLAGVNLSVTFAGQTYSGVTDSNGVFRTDWHRKLPSGDHYANVVDLALTGHVWDPLVLDLEDDSDGDGNPDQVLAN